MEHLIVKKTGKTTKCELIVGGTLLGALNDAKNYATTHNCNVEFTFTNQPRGGGGVPRSRQVTINKDSNLKRIHDVCSNEVRDVGP